MEGFVQPQLFETNLNYRAHKNLPSLNVIHQSQVISQNLNESLKKLLPTTLEDKDVQRAKKILGEISKHLSDDEIKDIVTEIKYLTDCWLDEFEQQLFKGKTLKEVLHDKGRHI